MKIRSIKNNRKIEIAGAIWKRIFLHTFVQKCKTYTNSYFFDIPVRKLRSPRIPYWKEPISQLVSLSSLPIVGLLICLTTKLNLLLDSATKL